MGTKFEGVDILDFLGQVVELHTQHYKEDFDVDKELIQKVALSGNRRSGAFSGCHGPAAPIV